MIPLKIQIKNFLSYGADIQSIDFGHYPLICLSGKNGHGKSALLDALTWALWGQARKLMGNAKADHGLLRLGQTQMMVCLDFECNGQQYRIRREFMQTYGKPVTVLDFGLLDQTNDRFISLTEKTIRDTQAKIEHMLHLTFDAFINSAFLRQGQSNEFSKKSAKERKEVLATILGLDRYETIRRLASERIKQSNTYKLHLTTLNTKLEQELAQAPLIAQQLLALEKQQKEIIAKEQLLEQTHQLLEHTTLEVQNKKQEIALLDYQKQQLIMQKESLNTQLREIFATWRKIHAQKRGSTDYESIEQQKKELLLTIKFHQQALQEQLNFKQELLTHKENSNRLAQEFYEKKLQEINTKKIAIERLHAEKKHLENSISKTEESLAHVENELQKYNFQKKELTKQIVTGNQNYSVIEKHFEKRKEYYQRWIAHANSLNAEINSLDKKNQLVHTEESPSCPLCEQNLSASRKRFLKNKFEETTHFLKQRLSRLSTVIKNLKIVLVAQHSQLEELKKQEENNQRIIIQMNEISKIISTYQTQRLDILETIKKNQELSHILAATVTAETQALEQLLTAHKQELETCIPYQTLQMHIANLESQIAAMNYNKDSHEKDVFTLNQLEKQSQNYHALQEAYLLQTQRAEQITNLCSKLKSIKQQLAQLHSQLLQKNLKHEQESLDLQKKELEQNKRMLAQTKDHLLHEKGSLQNQQNKLEQLKIEHTQQCKELAHCTTIIDDYQAIAQATGKDGIQALLIEDAIPEIEHEANELLAKLTDNQTQLFIESLRDLKKGGTKETLDIKISDSVGIRPYELFSGGEAFRIDFALRIAISKLLARRAGTSLQTLIIDEGFGSQDEEGLSNIMDSLYKIQDDFAKIIIVSHLSSMKNQFPVHFMINKSPNGSIVEIMEQG